jgi:ADP-heptose:LPS heptosyltransferase
MGVSPAEAAEAARDGITLLGDELVDFGDTAAVVTLLDLVICVDTSVAHLAGALACPTWIMVTHCPDARWLLGRSDSPWYPGVRLFRQPRRGDWASVVAEVRSALVAAIEGRAQS